MKGFVIGILVTLIALAAGTWWCLKTGYVNFAADQKPSALEAKLAMDAVDASTDRRAPQDKNPVAPTEENLAAGAKLYLDHCAGCHGLPSNPESEFARSFNPPVPAFFKDAPDMSEAQNFYIIEHGIRWTGMPAWDKTLSAPEIWKIVAFLSNIEKLPPAAQKVLGSPATNAPMPAHMNMPMNAPAKR
ncbi:MAG TPA: c-type cytochrome [Candidatus Acidoferrales bacterium]|nr:c-type cytochrome [Candidatus Acidoferrales bacterium]